MDLNQMIVFLIESTSHNQIGPKKLERAFFFFLRQTLFN